MLLEGRLAQGGKAVRLEPDGPRITRITAIDAAPELWLAPGLLDIQVNGYGGHDVWVLGTSRGARTAVALRRRGARAV